MYTTVSIRPSNQLLLPSRAMRFNIIAARKMLASSNIVNTNVTGLPIIIPAITRIGTTKSAI